MSFSSTAYDFELFKIGLIVSRRFDRPARPPPPTRARRRCRPAAGKLGDRPDDKPEPGRTGHADRCFGWRAGIGVRASGGRKASRPRRWSRRTGSVSWRAWPRGGRYPKVFRSRRPGPPPVLRRDERPLPSAARADLRERRDVVPRPVCIPPYVFFVNGLRFRTVQDRPDRQSPVRPPARPPPPTRARRRPVAGDRGASPRRLPEPAVPTAASSGGQESACACPAEGWSPAAGDDREGREAFRRARGRVAGVTTKVFRRLRPGVVPGSSGRKTRLPSAARAPGCSATSGLQAPLCLFHQLFTISNCPRSA